MKKYSLVTLLSLSFIHHAIAENGENVEEYYKKALESTQQLNAVKSETAETIHQQAAAAIKEIEKISKELTQAQTQAQAPAEEKAGTEKIQALQAKLSVLQAKLQADALKLQSLDMIQARDTKTKEELREEEIQKGHENLAKQLKEKLDKSNVPSSLGSLDVGL